MALGQRRMVYTNLWQSAQFAKLPDKAKILYIGLITLADDDGRLRADSLLLRSQVFPLDETIKQSDVRKWLNFIVRTGLVEVFRVDEHYFVQHPNWKKYQTIRKDLYKPSKIPSNPSRKRHGHDTEKNPNISKDNISKDNISKEKRPEASISYLKNIPTDDLWEFYQRFDASKKAIISKGEDLFLWCESNGRVKKNYKATLLNALKKDFPERRSDDKIKTSKLMEVDGKMKIVPLELQEEMKNLSNKLTIKKDD